jgi:MFS family permease
MTRASGLRGIAFVAFVSLGLPDRVLGIAWPSMREALGLGMGELGGLPAAAMVGYAVSAFASGALTARLGLGGLLLASSVVMGTSSLGYAVASGRGASFGAALLAGLGGGAIDGGVNAYAARRLSARLTTWLHASYVGYVIIAMALSAMTLAFARTRARWGLGGSADASQAGPEEPEATLRETVLR